MHFTELFSFGVVRGTVKKFALFFFLAVPSEEVLGADRFIVNMNLNVVASRHELEPFEC
jgi:hypothetical protein